MAKRIAKFEKVSFEQFKGGYTDAIGEASDEQIRDCLLYTSDAADE